MKTININKKQIKILSVLVVLGLSCAKQTTIRQETDLKQIEKNEIATNLSGKILLQDSLLLSTYIEDFFDDKVFMRCYVCDDMYYMYELRGDSLIQSCKLGEKGSGPKEFISPALYIDKKEKQIYLFERTGKFKAFKVSLNLKSEIGNPDNWIDLPMTLSNAEDVWKKFIKQGEDTIIALGGKINGSTLLSILLPKQPAFKSLNIHYPDDQNESQPGVKRFVYNNGNILKKTDGSKYLYYCSMGNYAEVLDLTDVENIKRKVLADSYPLYSIAKDGLNPQYDDESYTGLKSFVTNGYVYIIPEPYKKKEYLGKSNYKGYPQSYGDCLYVFDWNGNFIHLYKLDRPISTFAIDEKDSFLLGCTESLHNREICIVKYPLND